MQQANEADPDLAPAIDVVRSMGDVDSDQIIPLLQKIQDTYGYLPPKVLLKVSELTNIPASRMYGVATFYAQFHLEPHGKHTIRCCLGTACHVKGGNRIADTLRQILDVEEGGTTKDMLFTFEIVACLGTCFLAPVMMVDGDYYGNLSPGKVKKILERYS